MSVKMRNFLTAPALRSCAVQGVSGTIALLAWTLCCLLPPMAQAQDATWTAAGSGLWTEAANWTPNVAPSNNPGVYITNALNKTATIDAAAPAGNLTVTNLRIAAVGAATNTLLLNNTAPLLVAGTLQVGYTNAGSAGTSVGALVLDGGRLVTTNAAKNLVAYVGSGTDRIGIATVSNGTWLANEVSVQTLGKLTVAGGVLTETATGYGFHGKGMLLLDGTGVIYNTGSASFKSLTVSNGVLNTTVLNVGDQWGATPTASMNLAGGNVKVSATFMVGRNGGDAGTVVMTGGQLATANAYVGHSEYAPYRGSQAVGTMTVSNGTWLGNSVTVGNYSNSVGTLTLAGGTSILTNLLSVGHNARSTGKLNVMAGNLAITNAGGSALLRVGYFGRGTFTLTGGEVRADQFSVANGTNSVMTFAGGALSTRAATVNNGSAFVVGDGVGAATLNLVGGTNVNTFADGVVINTNGSLSVAGADAIGSARINGDLTLRQNACLDWNYNATTQDLAVVTGAVTLASSATVNLTSLDASTPRTIPLLAAAGGFIGTPSAWPLISAAGSLYQAQLSGNTLQMVRLPKGTLIQVF